MRHFLAILLMLLRWGSLTGQTICPHVSPGNVGSSPSDPGNHGGHWSACRTETDSTDAVARGRVRPRALSPAALTGQEAATARSLHLMIAAGLSAPLRYAGHGADLSAGLGVRRSLGMSGLAVEAVYSGLGRTTRRFPQITPQSAPATETIATDRTLLDLGLTADLAVPTGRFHPSLLLGLGIGQVSDRSRSVLKDTTGQALRVQQFTRWETRVRFLVGAGIALPPFRAALETRLHFLPFEADEDSWATIQFLTIGLRVAI